MIQAYLAKRGISTTVLAMKSQPLLDAGRCIIRCAWPRRGAVPAHPAHMRCFGLKIRDIRVVSLRPNHYHGRPTLTPPAQRPVVAHLVIGGREGHVCPFGQVELMRSMTTGKRIYPQFDLAIDTATPHPRDKLLRAVAPPCFRHWPTSIISTATPSTPTPQGMRAGGRDHRISAAERKAQLGTWMLRPTDGGGLGHAVDSSSGAPARADPTRRRPAALRGERPVETGKWNGVCERDDGKTWQKLAQIPTCPATLSCRVSRTARGRGRQRHHYSADPESQRQPQS